MNAITQIGLPLILAFIMFSMGLSLVWGDFKRIAQYPKAFLAGTLLQMVALPALAFLLANFWETNPEFAVGLIIIAACPGGVTSNLMTHLARGDSALSISLTAVISIVSVFSIPFLVNAGLSVFMEAEAVTLPLLKTIVGIFAITTVPVALGMLVKKFKSSFADQLEPVARKVATVLFVVMVLGAVAKDWNLLKTHFLEIGPMTFSLNLLTMGVAFFVARLLSLSKKQATAITLECGLQNGTMAIFIALTLLGNSKMMLPGGIYSILMFLSGGLYVVWSSFQGAEVSRTKVVGHETQKVRLAG